MNTTTKGQCHCGAIRFEFSGEPVNTYFCCCSECQRLSGSDKLLLTAVPLEHFHLTSGTPGSYQRTGGSGNRLTYYFCKDCGFTLYARPEAVAFYAIAVNNLERPQDFPPRMAIHTASRPAWSQLPDDLPQFAGSPQA